jgi:hypothetical protein
MRESVLPAKPTVKRTPFPMETSDGRWYVMVILKTIKKEEAAARAVRARFYSLGILRFDAHHFLARLAFHAPDCQSFGRRPPHCRRRFRVRVEGANRSDEWANSPRNSMR